MSDFRELSPDPKTAFVAPGDTGWRDWFLKLGAFLVDIVKVAPGYQFTPGQMVVAAVDIVADSTAITVVDDVPCFPSFEFADLPDPADVPYARVFITDSSVTTFLTAAAGGGADIVPVFSDGIDWVVG